MDRGNEDDRRRQLLNRARLAQREAESLFRDAMTFSLRDLPIVEKELDRLAGRDLRDISVK